MSNTINLLSNLGSYKDRVFINNEKTKNIINNNPDIKATLVKTAQEDKNLLTKVNKSKKDINDLCYQMMLMAAISFKKELQLYRKIEGTDHSFSSAMENAYKTKNYQYLQTRYGKISLGQALTNLFYGGKADDLDAGLNQFLIKMSNLDTHKFIEDMEVSNVNIVTNLIQNKLEEFFQGAKAEKNYAVGTGSSENIEIFSNVYNEKLIFDFLQKQKESFSDKEIAKMFPIEMKKIIEDAKKSGGANVRKKVQEGNMNLAESYFFIIQFLCTSLQESVTEELKNIELKEGDIYTFVLDILSDKNIIKVSKQGYNNQKGKYVLASYTINMQKLREKVAKYVVNNNETNKNNQGILSKIEESDVRNIMNEGVKAVLEQYNAALHRYLYNVGGVLAWEYYEKNLLKDVVNITLRDWEDAMKPSPVSEVYKEISKANTASIHAAEWNKSIKQLEELEKKITQSNTLSRNDEMAIEKIVDKFSKTDKDDTEMVKAMKDAFASQDYSKGLKILEKRLISKRGGYLANFSGTIGEIFITVIASKTSPKSKVYQRGASINQQGQQAHADITIDDIGIQSKVYQQNNIKLYPNTKVTFRMRDALRYLNTTTNKTGETINEDELEAFRFFLLNNTILKELSINEWSDNDFLTALNLRLANFIRFSDGLTDLENIKNNFFIINFNIVPASVIFLKMADMFKNEEIFSNKLIDFFNETDYVKLAGYNPQNHDPSNYLIKNLLEYLSGSYALFKSFILDLSDLGVDIF